jgi:hypothetical protein
MGVARKRVQSHTFGERIFCGGKGNKLGLTLVTIRVDTSSIQQKGKSNESPGSSSTVLAVHGFGDLVLVQVVEFKKGCFNVAGA